MAWFSSGEPQWGPPAGSLLLLSQWASNSAAANAWSGEPAMLCGIAVFGLAGLLYYVARQRWTEELRRQAREVLKPGEAVTGGFVSHLKRLTGDRLTQAELASYGAITAAEYVWSWTTIDPDVVKAAAFSTGEAIRNGYDFVQHVHDHVHSATTEGFQNRLLGYVGEQQVANLLANQGHAVQLAETANQPVWDLVIDGHLANVKTVGDIASIKADALANPEVSYIVPEDAHGEAVGNIVRLLGFHHDAAQESVSEAMATAKGETAAANLASHLPWITLAFAIYRNYRAVQCGKDPWVAVKHTAMETLGRGAGIVIGAKVGATVGSTLGPVGTVLGAVLAGLLGGVAGGSIVEEWKRRPLRRALEDLRLTLHEFGARFATRLDSIREYLEIPLRRMQRAAQELQAQVEARKSHWRWWLWPDFYTVLLEEARDLGLRRVNELEEAVARVTGIFTEAQRTGRYEKVGLLMVNCPIVRELVGDDDVGLKRVMEARRRVLYERKQLNPHLPLPAE